MKLSIENGKEFSYGRQYSTNRLEGGSEGSFG